MAIQRLTNQRVSLRKKNINLWVTEEIDEKLNKFMELYYPNEKRMLSDVVRESIRIGLDKLLSDYEAQNKLN